MVSKTLELADGELAEIGGRIRGDFLLSRLTIFSAIENSRTSGKLLQYDHKVKICLFIILPKLSYLANLLHLRFVLTLQKLGTM